MEKFDWTLLIGRFGEEQRRLQKEQNEASGGWFKMSVWAILLDAGNNEKRISELGAMMRSCEQLLLLDEIDASMSSHFATASVADSEQALRQRLLAADSKDISQEIMQDAIDCVLSRLKRRVAQGTALFASLEKFVTASTFHPPRHPNPIPTAVAAATTATATDTAAAPDAKDKEETVPSPGSVNDSSTDVEKEEDGSCAIF